MISKCSRGAVLVSVMIYMLVLSIIGISSMRGTALEERMASNQWEHTRAFQAAESALKDAGEWFLFQPNLIEASSDGRTGIWSTGTVTSLVNNGSFDWTNHGIVYGSDSGNSPALFGDLHMQPKYVIEQVGFEASDNDPDTLAKLTGVFYYNISALGGGRSQGARSVVQTTLKKHHN